jgi:DNA repair protein RecN (Recombination protein N)
LLRELHIQNLAVIHDITVELDPGLNCFTGQTGAGKSLIIGALEILLGLRQPTDMLRKGAGASGDHAEGRVSGLFHITSKNLRQEIANATDLPLDAEPELLITRRLFESRGGGGGRTSASINGTPITNAMLKQVGEILVDVHGQHDAQFLLKPANQLAVLDEFGNASDLRQQFTDLYRRRQELLAQQKELATSRTLRKQQLELYEFQAREIDEAQLVAGEYETLVGRNRVLANLEKIKRTSGAAYGVLYEEEGAILSRLKSAAAILLELAQLDDALAPIATQVKDATLSLDDAAFSLRRYVDRLDLDPEELETNHQRLNLVTRLIDKYVGRNASGTVEEVLAYRRQIAEKIEELRAQDQDFSTSARQIADLESQLRDIGATLSAARKKAADKLAPLVHAQLADLGMKEARFHVELQPIQSDLAPAAKAPAAKSHQSALGTQDLQLTLADFSTSSGLETVEFMIAPNPGQPARPLRRIASGGELSRVMLALKSITAARGGADRVSVLVFDEIDANVGGRMGTVIGEKLRDLAAFHQVLCITHLPQIAAFADRHLTIRKSITGSPTSNAGAAQTTTTVSLMTGEARILELAEMTAGPSPSHTALSQARELLSTGTGGKRKRRPGA